MASLGQTNKNVSSKQSNIALKPTTLQLVLKFKPKRGNTYACPLECQESLLKLPDNRFFRTFSFLLVEVSCSNFV